MRIVIAGCGRVGSDLALTLSEEGHDVSVVDKRPEVFARLGSTFNGTTHEGLGYDVQLLRETGVEMADAFVAATDSDNANAMAVQVAKRVFGVPKTIARLDDPAREEAYRALDVQFVPGAKLTSKVIHEQIVGPEFSYHVTFAAGNVEVVDMTIGPEGAGIRVSDFEMPGSLRVAAVYRGHKTIIPDDDFVLSEDDVVVASVRTGARKKIRRYIAEKEAEL
ncbi:MAG TPA: NAD-binding protein [Acidimicrobiia bacterium]|jgi:trk system potassium uptake protein TrkA|nr:NAD-binding protein [Acidimicrobiia bacterium]